MVRKGYPSDMTDAKRAILEPMLPPSWGWTTENQLAGQVSAACQGLRKASPYQRSLGLCRDASHPAPKACQHLMRFRTSSSIDVHSCLFHTEVSENTLRCQVNTIRQKPDLPRCVSRERVLRWAEEERLLAVSNSGRDS